MSNDKPPAFQAASGNRLGVTLSIVALIHLLLIVLLLSYFDWLSSADSETETNAGQSGIIIQVTLETEPPDSAMPAEPVPEIIPEPTPNVAEDLPLAAELPVQPAPSVPSVIPLPNPPKQPTQPTQPNQPTPPKPAKQSPPQTPANSLSDGKAQINTSSNAAQFVPAQVDPNYLHRPSPAYPALSKRLREAGTVLLRVSLDDKGIVQDIAIQTSSDFQRLDQAALEAVRQWRFIPASRGAQPVSASVLIPIEFKQP